MLLERILAHLEVDVEAFALCEVGLGWSLNLVPPRVAVLHFVLGGHGEMHAGKAGTFELAPNRLALVPAGIGHSLEPDGPALHVMTADSADIPAGSGVHRIQAGEAPPAVLVACGKVQVRYGGVAGLFDRLREPVEVDFSDAPAIRNAFTSMLKEQALAGPGSDAMTTALMNQCFIMFLRRLSGSGGNELPWLQAVADEQLGRVVDKVLERPQDPHTVDTLADLAGMSRSTFTAHFRKAFDKSRMDFVRLTRLEVAARLLRTTDLGIRQVAAGVGIRSRSHFTRSFARHYGISPDRYRRSEVEGAAISHSAN